MNKILTRVVSLAAVTLFSISCMAQVAPKPPQTPKRERLSKIIGSNPQLVPQTTTITANSRARKDWNFIVYFAANNNLREFAVKNIHQMLQVGSSNTMNVLFQLDEISVKEVTRYYVQKGSITPVYQEHGNNACVSGTPESLYEFVKWSLQNYPANHHCLVLWNHGSGIKDPSIWGRLVLSNRNELFVFNKTTGLYEINRKIMRQQGSLPHPFPHLLTERGIAFNDTFETYLTNQDLTAVLGRVSRELLGGQKLDILSMDACHMEMIEVGSQVKDTVKYMVGSSEVEPGAGYDYSMVLAPFASSTLTPDIFAKHIVQAYGNYYYPTHGDYTQSAINVDLVSAMEENFKQITKILTNLISSPQGSICAKLIRDIRFSRANTVEFNDPDYIDLGKFYLSLHQSLLSARKGKDQSAVSVLKEKVRQGLTILQRMIIANVAGSSLNEATGLSFYFPIRTIHNSYLKTAFDKTTKWSTFLNKFFRTREADKPTKRKK